ncbi:MAG: hypothetical protein U0941_29920 [Planctomycetaceae bacterium]
MEPESPPRGKNSDIIFGLFVLMGGVAGAALAFQFGGLGAAILGFLAGCIVGAIAFALLQVAAEAFLTILPAIIGAGLLAGLGIVAWKLWGVGL